MDKITFDESRYNPPETKAYLKNLSHQKIIEHTILHVLTCRQREMITYYYYKRKNIPQIARETGVNKSTVSRTIKRGMEKLRKHLNYFDNMS